MTIVFLFPGQSSCYPGMLEKAVHLHAPNGELLEWASDLLDWDLRTHFRADNPDAYARNLDVQVGVFLANHMFLEVLNAHGIHADVSLGLSLGEYNHLVHIGAVELRDALLAVKARGEAYDAGPPGWMASMQPMALDALDEVVQTARQYGPLEIVNLNAPTQHVISGARAAVEAAVRIAEDEHYAQPVIIEKQIPMHSSLFEPVGVRFAAALRQVPFSRPRLPYIPNRLGHVLEDPTTDDFRDLLSSHVYRPVLWRDSIDHVRTRWPDAVFVEVGPKAVLHNLLRKKWCNNRKFKTDSTDDAPAHLAEVLAELQHLISQTETAGC